MFCFSCGVKIVNESRFCPNCGANLEGVKGNASNQVHVNQNSVEDEDEDEDEEYTLEDIVEAIFSEVFISSKIYGDKVYILEKGPIPQKINENIYKYYFSKNNYEKVLLVFDYENNLEQGFIITNRRFIWHYNSIGRHEIDLIDIKDIVVGKALLATVMKFISFENVEYKNMYLTGIFKEADFISKFRRFITELLLVVYDNDEDYDEATMNIVQSEIISKICRNSFKNSSGYCEIGNPVISPASSKKYINACAYFNIAQNEDIYLIFDSTILGGCRKGFAICSSGLYYNESKVGYFSWSTFKKIKISSGLAGLKIDDQLFNTATDSQKLLIILKSIQESI